MKWADEYRWWTKAPIRANTSTAKLLFFAILLRSRDSVFITLLHHFSEACTYSEFAQSLALSPHMYRVPLLELETTAEVQVRIIKSARRLLCKERLRHIAGSKYLESRSSTRTEPRNLVMVFLSSLRLPQDKIL